MTTTTWTGGDVSVINSKRQFKKSLLKTHEEHYWKLKTLFCSNTEHSVIWDKHY